MKDVVRVGNRIVYIMADCGSIYRLTVTDQLLKYATLVRKIGRLQQGYRLSLSITLARFMTSWRQKVIIKLNTGALYARDHRTL